MPTQQLVDLKGRDIVVGSIVTIDDGANTSFDRSQGLVMDIASDFETEDGPIAVFFNGEVENYKFGRSQHLNPDKWTGPVPTPENYQGSGRIICFEPRELVVADEWSVETLAKRYYGNWSWHHLYQLTFRLIPGIWDCHFADCKSGLMATERTLINYWGTILEFYTCTECHKARNGMCTEYYRVKDPLPGGRPIGPEPDRNSNFGARYYAEQLGRKTA